MKHAIEFMSQGQRIAGYLYLDDHGGDEPRPAIILCHGFCGVKELLLPAFAERFAAAGYAALTFDYRGFGDSDGEPGRLVPELQIEDCLAALDWLTDHESIDAGRIGLWGTSFGGGNALSATARDPRVRCVCAQGKGAQGKEGKGARLNSSRTTRSRVSPS